MSIPSSMNERRVAITGLNGVIGQGFIGQPFNNIKVFDLYHSRISKLEGAEHIQVDLRDPRNVISTLDDIKPDVIIHMAAITHIDRCEKDRVNGKQGDVWKVNVESTRAIANYAKAEDKRIIYLSTECVFDGECSFFTENSDKNPKNWYGFTKSRAEDIVLSDSPNCAILRAVMVYHEDDQGKTLFEAFLSQLKEGKEVLTVSDQRMTPTYRLDIIKALLTILEKDLKGIFHIAPLEPITPLEFAQKIANHFDYDRTLIRGITLKEYFGRDGALLRLKNACLDCKDSIDNLGFIPVSLDQVLKRV